MIQEFLRGTSYINSLRYSYHEYFLRKGWALPVNGSSLVKRNIWLDGRRTSIRLEHELWEALTRVAFREGLSINDLCTRIDERRTRGTLTSAIRSHLVRRLLLNFA